MSAEAKELFDAHHRARYGRPGAPVFHLQVSAELDAWKAVEEAASHAEELREAQESSEYWYMAHDALEDRVNAMQKQTQRLLENVSPKTSKASLLMVINALRVELAKCVP